MREDFSCCWFEWEDIGYVGCPAPSEGLVFPADPMKSPAHFWLAVLQETKQGNFSSVPILVDILLEATPSSLAVHCADLIGDAGTSQCFQRILEELKRTDRFTLANQLCHAIWLRGKLSGIPVLLETYEKHQADKDADIFPVWISDLLGPSDPPYSVPDAFRDLAAFRTAVMAHYSKLVDQFGSEDVIVFEGKQFGVRTLAERALELVRLPYFGSDIRHKFEATTGVDCSGFYKDGQLQPLAAAAILEDFLASPEAANYEEGVRYFFGHRIPD